MNENSISIESKQLIDRPETEHTMMNNGDANIEIREATLRYPTNICRLLSSNNSRLTQMIRAKAHKTAIRSPHIFSCTHHRSKLTAAINMRNGVPERKKDCTFLVLSAYLMKRATYTNWKKAPIELTVATKMTPWATQGSPYQKQIKQLSREYMQGSPENCSVERFLAILLNVGLEK